VETTPTTTGPEFAEQASAPPDPESDQFTPPLGAAAPLVPVTVAMKVCVPPRMRVPVEVKTAVTVPRETLVELEVETAATGMYVLSPGKVKVAP